MVLTAICDNDNCENESSGHVDYDGEDLCPQCIIKKELVGLKSEKKEQIEWLKRTFIKEVIEMGHKIKKLEIELSLLKNSGI